MLPFLKEPVLLSRNVFRLGERRVLPLLQTTTCLILSLGLGRPMSLTVDLKNKQMMDFEALKAVSAPFDGKTQA